VEGPLWGARNWVLHEGPDGPDGLLDWKVTRDFDLDGSFGAVDVGPIIAATPQAHRDLWAYLGALDVIDEVQLHNLPPDEPARWLMADGRALREGYAGDFVWLALLDVPAALSARAYTVPGRLVLDVVDDSVTAFAKGRVLLDASADGAQCSPTTATPDLTLPASALASAYLGGYGLRALSLAGGVDEHTAGALTLFDAMLRTGLAPFCQTGF